MNSPELIAPSSTKAMAPTGNLVATYISLGELQETRGKVKEAIAAYQKALEQQPHCAEVYLALGRLFAQQRVWEKSIWHYQQALNLQPKWWKGYQTLAEAYRGWGDLAAATRCYRCAIALAPNQPTLHRQLGILLEQQNKIADACESYRRAIALDAYYAGAYSNLGCALAQLDQLEDAVKALQTAINLRPEVAGYYNNLGQVLVWQQQTKDAIAIYQQAIELKPDYALAYHNLGKALQYEGWHAEAAPCFQKVTQLQPKNLVAYGDWGRSLMALGEIEKALACWRDAIAPQAQQVQAYQEWVETRFQSPQDEWEGAKLACARFLQALQASKFQQARTFLQQIYRCFGDATARYGIPQQAETYYQNALRLQPRDSELQTRLGNSLAQQGKSASAIAVYRAALTIHPHHPQANFQLGKLLEQQSKWESAIACYQTMWSGQTKQNLQLQNSCAAKQIKPPQNTYPSTRAWLASNNYLDNYHYIELDGDKNIASEATSNQNKEVTCRGLDCTPCLKQVFNWFQPLQLGYGIHNCTFPQTPPVTSFSRFVARILNGRAWAVPQQNHWLICKAFAVITPDNSVLSDVSRDYPGQLPPCSGNGAPHEIFEQKTLPPVEAIKGKVAVLTGLSGNVYFHWIIDILPRIALLYQAGIDPKTLHGIWINQASQPFQQETLNILGISPEKIIASDDHPHIQAEELIVPSFSGHLGWLPPWGLKFLRETFLPPLLNRSNAYPKRIYIRRTGARHRRVLNEEAVIDYLQTRGFVPVSLEELSFSEQLNWFASAEAIVAPHGSGLTNLVFCSARTKVIELFSPNYIRHYFWVISQQLQLEHYYLVGEAIACDPIRDLMYQNSLSEDIWVNLAALKLALDQAKLD